MRRRTFIKAGLGIAGILAMPTRAPAFIYRDRFSQKPAFGSVEIDWSHPLALGLMVAWLFNEGGGITASNMSAIGSGDGTLSGTLPTWGVGNHGLMLESAASGSYVVSTRLVNTALVTISVRVQLVTGDSGSARYAGFSDGNGSGTFDKIVGHGPTGHYEFYVFDGAAKRADSGQAAAVGDDYLWTGVADGTNAIIYRDGISKGSIGAGNTFTGYTVPNFIVFGQNAGFLYSSARITLCSAWQRPLTPQEVAWYSAEPYAFLRPRIVRRYFMPSTPSTATIPQRTMTGVGL